MGQSPTPVESEKAENMALIGRLNRVTKDRQSVHGEVEACVSVLRANDGLRYIQIDTIGSKDRARAGQVNQTIVQQGLSG